MASARAAAVRVLRTLLPSSGNRPASCAESFSCAAAVDNADLTLLADSLEQVCPLLPEAAPCSV